MTIYYFLCQIWDGRYFGFPSSTHSTKKMRHCPHCNTEYLMSQASMWRHLQKHKGVKYKCKLCDYQHMRTDCIKQHMIRKHSVAQDANETHF